MHVATRTLADYWTGGLLVDGEYQWSNQQTWMPWEDDAQPDVDGPYIQLTMSGYHQPLAILDDVTNGSETNIPLCEEGTSMM